MTAPAMGFTLMDFYSNNPGSAYGIWILIAEVGICGVLPAILLVSSGMRRNPSAALPCCDAWPLSAPA